MLTGPPVLPLPVLSAPVDWCLDSPQLPTVSYRTTTCRFSGLRIYPGRGIQFIRIDGAVWLLEHGKVTMLVHVAPKTLSQSARRII